MADKTRPRSPHAEDAQNFVLIEIIGDAWAWVNLTQVFRVELVEDGGSFFFDFYSGAIAAQGSNEFFNVTRSKGFATVDLAVEKAKEVFWNFPGSIGVEDPP